MNRPMMVYHVSKKAGGAAHESVLTPILINPAMIVDVYAAEPVSWDEGASVRVFRGGDGGADVRVRGAMSDLMNTAYLGDFVYARADGDQIVLTTENGDGPSNTIVLEPEVWRALVNFVGARPLPFPFSRRDAEHAERVLRMVQMAGELTTARKELEAARRRATEERNEARAATDELCEALTEALLQTHGASGLPGHIDSFASSTIADAMRLLARHGYLQITRGASHRWIRARVTPKWPDAAPPATGG